MLRAAAIKGEVPIMAVKAARLYFLPWCPGHRTLVALKGGVWRQNLQSTYGGEAFVDTDYETCFHFEGL